MKTVLLINSSGARYFKRVNGLWQSVEKAEQNDRLWVIANLSEETLETFAIPFLFGSDRSNFLQRNLSTGFPHSQYRAAPMFSGNRFTAGTAILTGLTSPEAVSREIDKLTTPVAGVWGISIVLALLLRKHSINNVMLALPSTHYLRILVLKDGIPVITRYIHRYNEEKDGDANEILRTRQHLENKRIFERDSIPPVLYLGDTAVVGEQLSRAGIVLLPLPAALEAKGEAAWLHPVFELLVTTPDGQLAPLQLRAAHLTERLRHLAYGGIALSILAAILFGQADFSELLSLHGKEQLLEAQLKKANLERETLAARISATGTDPALVRQATKFSELEMEAAPTPDSILQFTASTIADLPQVRIKSLTYRFPKPDEHYCEGHTVIELPLLKQKIDLSPNFGSKPADSDIQHFTELQFSILLTDNLAPEAQIEIRKRISAVLKAKPGVQLMLDPAAFSLLNTLKGGFGTDKPQTENIWCMSIPWNAASPEKPLPTKGGEQP